MAQILFSENYALMTGVNAQQASYGILSFIPHIFFDSISFNTLNIPGVIGAKASFTLQFGLYSLNGSTLSLSNSISGTVGSSNTGRAYISLTDTSATQNITPGVWWFGLLLQSTSSNNSLSFLGNSTINPENAFPGGFIVGRMTDSTNGLPSSYATSDLDTTGNDAIFVPNIIISA